MEWCFARNIDLQQQSSRILRTVIHQERIVCRSQFLLLIIYIMKIIFLTLNFLFLSITNNSVPGDGYQIGDVATDFSLPNVDGKMVSLSDFADAKGFIVIFTCNTCPYSSCL